VGWTSVSRASRILRIALHTAPARQIVRDALIQVVLVGVLVVSCWASVPGRFARSGATSPFGGSGSAGTAGGAGRHGRRSRPRDPEPAGRHQGAGGSSWGRSGQPIPPIRR